MMHNTRYKVGVELSYRLLISCDGDGDSDGYDGDGAGGGRY